MSEFVSEKQYPVEFRWIFKSVSGFVIATLISIVLWVFGFVHYYLLLIVLYSPIHFVMTILRRQNFHFALENKFLMVKQGVINKQEKNLPYGVIQNLIINRDLFDKIFGLASLVVENASQAGGVKSQPVKKGSTGPETIGAAGNKVSIPGLTPENANKLKAEILLKMKENPNEDGQSGL